MKYLPEKAFYYGLDISMGMLMKCRKNMTRWKREIELFQGNAEFLPFKEETFDSVFHVGGINFFNDRKRAIEEMIRVAKPGAKIAIADEMEKTIVKQYEKMPIAKKYYNLSKIDKSRLVAPVDLVPVDMKDIKVKEILKRFYILTFRKP
jgi:ubiquinone/menaquinone biosynthesis C-methylase UbiE